MEEAADGLAELWLGDPESPAVRAFREGRCVDYQIAEPWGKGQWIKNSAVVEPRDQEREPFEGVPLVHFFRTRPALAAHKVFCFRQAHRLTREAASALLKTLEEPHGYGRLVLTTDRFSTVPATVRSRCACVPWALGPRETGDPVGEAFGESPGMLAKVERHRQVYENLYALLVSTDSAPPYAADGLAERFRQCGEKLAQAHGTPARQGHMEALRCAAAYVRRVGTPRPDLLLRVVRAHHDVESYAAVGLVTDALFVRWVGLGTPGAPQAVSR